MSETPALGYLVATVVFVGFAVACWLVGWLILQFGRSLGAAWSSRGESAEVPEEFDTQPRTSERDESDDLDDAVLLTHEKRDDEEDEAFCVDFVAWEKECAVRPRIARYVAKLEERAR